MPLRHCPRHYPEGNLADIIGDIDPIDPIYVIIICCAGSVSYRSNAGNMCKAIQIAWLPPGNMIYTSFRSSRPGICLPPKTQVIY